MSSIPSREQVLDCRALYEGRRIRFIAHGEYDPRPLEPGVIGTVTKVDDICTLHTRWDNGRFLGVILGVDQFDCIRVFPDRGRRSPGFGHLGMWNLGLGPNSPIPSQRLEVAILDLNGGMARRFEQVRGTCTDPGYVDFFLSHNCRPATHEYPLVDIGADGKVAGIVCPHYTQAMGPGPYLQLLEKWVTAHGKPEWAIPADAQAGQIRVV